METPKKLKKSTKIRLAKEKMAEYKEANKGRLGAIKTSLRNTPTTPRKMRLVADMIRGERVNIALNILQFDSHHASKDLEKLLMTSIADWQLMNENIKIEEADLYVKEVYVDCGKMLKRLQPAPQGRAHRIRKRSNHVTLVIDSMQEGEVNNLTEKETEG